jgi:hypothetical protein
MTMVPEMESLRKAAAGQVLVQVEAAGINPGEAKIRAGLEDSRWPATFPSGEGSDLAGIVTQAGSGVTSFSAGDQVIGWTDNRASHAEYVVVEEQRLTAKPAGVPWDVAGALFVAGTTADAAVRAVGLTEGDTVVVSGAAGGVGSISVQLARLAGATVIGLASEAHHSWLAGHGVIPVTYGHAMADRIRQAVAWMRCSQILAGDAAITMSLWAKRSACSGTMPSGQRMCAERCWMSSMTDMAVPPDSGDCVPAIVRPAGLRSPPPVHSATGQGLAGRPLRLVAEGQRGRPGRRA